MENGTLKVLAGACPKLVAEAGLYRYADDATGRRCETPVDEHNHALAALRYLISRIDARHLARGPKLPSASAEPPDEPANEPQRRTPWWRDPATEHWWTRVW